MRLARYCHEEGRRFQSAKRAIRLCDDAVELWKGVEVVRLRGPLVGCEVYYLEIDGQARVAADVGELEGGRRVVVWALGAKVAVGDVGSVEGKRDGVGRRAARRAVGERAEWLGADRGGQEEDEERFGH